MSNEYEIRYQRENRMHRIGQPAPPIVYIDIENIDQRIHALMADKQRVVMDFSDLELTLFQHQLDLHKKLIDVRDIPSLRHSPYMLWIGARVRKKLPNRRRKNHRTRKPFKSGSKINTVKGLILHPILAVEAFTFHEDESYVECRRCELVDEVCVCTFDPYDDGDTEESYHYKRTCLHCGHSWFGLHCIHDGVQNPCPGCDVRPTPIPETT